MKRVWILAALWAGAWGWSIVGAHLAPPTGDGFTRGLNRLGLFLTWQGVAMILALLLLGQRHRLPAGWPRRLAAVPLGLAVGLLVLVALVILWSQLQHVLHPPAD